MAENNEKNWDQSQLRKYNIQCDQIPRLRFDDPKVLELILQNKPVVILGSDLVKSTEKWDLEYLEKNMGDSDFTVFQSRNHLFKFFDDKKVNQLLSNYKMEFTPPTKRIDIKLSEFCQRLREWKKGDDRLYLQQLLNNTVGPAIVDDFLHFKWDWLSNIQKLSNWGPLTSNLLLISMEGNVTPCHYDEQQNLFAQITGYKRCILFPPEQFECLYPHPVYHPHDRQSQVDFENPDLKKFPKFSQVKGQETVLGPGDVLYIPIYWWHHIESLMRGGYTFSINFWYKAGPTGPITYPLKSRQKVAIMRNVEKMVINALADPREVGPLFRALVLGRYAEASSKIDDNN
ncbi:Hypoxia-inducible factor 1 alpha inhibitor, putative [Pediculus humanus corporis]|uniref:Hypoxia-inducible factor 1 alpha inhibitor, putative n=1 Tax=Pediculus humanus subsp. corporis TaxID=121224 RepID=E0VRZ8_PEDHC|nr:Hypoxia-inducible factor 1 alpha inhibitor, putative [Pediculus humanus corporis]EEB16154.1 Hypoxia-inducible factor 1 alpha inhibitor, putative [Pediculus humanus corporis]